MAEINKKPANRFGHSSRHDRRIKTDAHYWGIEVRRRNNDIPTARQWLMNKLKCYAHDLTVFGIIRIVSKFWKGYYQEDKNQDYQMLKRDTYPLTDKQVENWEEEHRTWNE